MPGPLRLERVRDALQLVGGPRVLGLRVVVEVDHAALSGELDQVAYRTDPVFGFDVPVEVPGVDRSLLDPRSTWRDPTAYDTKAAELAAMFTANFEKFAAETGTTIAAAGPRV